MNGLFGAGASVFHLERLIMFTSIRQFARLSACGPILFSVLGFFVISKPLDGAVIQPSSNPGNTPGDAFDVNNAGVTYSLGSGTSLVGSSSNLPDLFGGEDPKAPEPGGVIFADGQPSGSVETVIIHLPEAIAITGFNFWVNEDGGSADRSIRELILFSGATMIDDVIIIPPDPSDPTHIRSYDDVYNAGTLEVSDVLNNVPASATYTLQLIQNQNNTGSRAAEFDAFVPEPASLTLLCAGALTLITRRRTAL